MTLPHEHEDISLSRRDGAAVQLFFDCVVTQSVQIYSSYKQLYRPT